MSKRTLCCLLTLIPSLLATSLQAATLIVANKAEATVSLVDLPSGKVAATLPVGVGPHEVAVSPSGRLALIANYGNQAQQGSTLTLIDVPAAKVLKTIDLGEYRRPHGLAWLDERRALVTSEQSKALLEIDAEEGKVAGAAVTGQEVSHMVAVAPGAPRAFVANIRSGSITAVDLEDRKRISDIATGAGAEGIAVTPDGKQVWVTNREADTVSVIDAASLQVLANLPSASFPIRAEVTPDGKHVLVSNARSGDLSVFSVADRKLARRVSLESGAMGKGKGGQEGRLLSELGGSVPIGIEIAPDGKRAYVAHANADEISIVDLESWKKVGSLTAGREPDGMGYSKLDVKTGTK
jgi:YVTN family beta-propeller protein